MFQMRFILPILLILAFIPHLRASEHQLNFTLHGRSGPSGSGSGRNIEITAETLSYIIYGPCDGRHERAQAFHEEMQRLYTSSPQWSFGPFPENEHLRQSTAQLKKDTEKIRSSIAKHKQSISRLQGLIEKRNLLRAEGCEPDHEDMRARLIDGATTSMKVSRDYFENDQFEEGGIAATVADVFLDLATSFTPGVSLARDIYEAFSGRNLITGEDLESWEQGLAMFSASTFGFPGMAEKVFKVAKKFGGYLSRKGGVELAIDFVHRVRHNFPSWMTEPFHGNPERGSIRIFWDHAKGSAEEFEAFLSKLSPGERVAHVRGTGAVKASQNGWTKNSQLKKKNNRDIYTDQEGTHWALDTLHGRWEKFNKRNGRHEGEFNFDGLVKDEPILSRRIEL